MEQDVKILDKIKKCLALSASSEPHEAAAALRQAQKLMEKHGVTQIDLGRAELDQADVKSKFSVSRMKDYELSLVSQVSKAFGCRVLWRKSRSHNADVFGKFILIGLKAQVPLAHYTVEVMQRKLVKARAAYVSSLFGYDRGVKVQMADAFCKGWVAAVAKTVYEFAMNAETKELLDNEVKRIVEGRKSKPQDRGYDRHGYAAGQKAGAGESIHRPMGETKHKFLN